MHIWASKCVSQIAIRIYELFAIANKFGNQGKISEKPKNEWLDKIPTIRTFLLTFLLATSIKYFNNKYACCFLNLVVILFQKIPLMDDHDIRQLTEKNSIVTWNLPPH